MEGFFEELKKYWAEWFGSYRHYHKRTDLLKYTLKIESGYNASTDATGNLTLPIYRNTTGRNLAIGRIFVWADTFNPGNPYSHSGFYGYISSAPGNPGTMKDFWPAVSGTATQTEGLPYLQSYSGLNALRFEQNETVYANLFSGPATTNVMGKIFGFLEPIASDYEL